MLAWFDNSVYYLYSLQFHKNIPRITHILVGPKLEKVDKILKNLKTRFYEKK